MSNDNAGTGFANRDEILAALNELLEAERAGAHVALASSKSADDRAYAELMRAVHKDEARWCAMLSDQIKGMGGSPSRQIGAFREKALAIADPLERLAFLNRGQSWVIRRLEALMPRVRDDSLRGDLREMLDSHCSNIARADVVIRTGSAAG